MKIISWNVNGFRAAAKKYAIDDLIREHDPDILFLQEMKCTEQEALDISQKYANSLRGDYLWHVDGSTIPGRHGVGMFVKEALLYDANGNKSFRWHKVDFADPLVDGGREARIQLFEINDVLFLNTYSVNVRPDLCRLQQRADFDAHIYALMDIWKAQGSGKSVVLGDFNVVSELIDYHGPALSKSMAGMTDSERSSFKTLLSGHNLNDTFRKLRPEEEKYSYWSYRGYARDNNKGWRIDYILASDALMPHIIDADILTNVQGSDHAPVILEIEDLNQ